MRPDAKIDDQVLGSAALCGGENRCKVRGEPLLVNEKLGTVRFNFSDDRGDAINTSSQTMSFPSECRKCVRNMTENRILPPVKHKREAEWAGLSEWSGLIEEAGKQGV